MIRPACFGYNGETAADNHFQHLPEKDNPSVQEQALAEFDQMVSMLRAADIEVLVMEDDPTPAKPDAIYPNNWISTNPEGKIFIYPMCAPSRRPEKRDDIPEMLARDFSVTDVQDWSEFEAEGRFLEGTGSMVMDHSSKLIYAAVSERTSLSVLEKFAATNGYHAIVFLATDAEGRPIYHTNVMICLGDGFCVLCEEAIEEEWELIAVRQLLESSGHTIIPISREQMNAFAGNMLALKNKIGENILVLSQAAFASLKPKQRSMLDAYARLLPVPVPTIEKTGGGSVRCMMAEIFLEKKAN